MHRIKSFESSEVCMTSFKKMLWKQSPRMTPSTWWYPFVLWRHHIDALSVLLPLCEWSLLVIDGSTYKGHVMRSFDALSFNPGLNKSVILRSHEMTSQWKGLFWALSSVCIHCIIHSNDEKDYDNDDSDDCDGDASKTKTTWDPTSQFGCFKVTFVGSRIRKNRQNNSRDTWKKQRYIST